MKLSQRLAALEAGVIDTGKKDTATAFADHLKVFIDGVFDAFRSAAHTAYGDGWPKKMAETIESTLDRVCEIHGDDGPMMLAKAFPGVLIASKIAFEGMRL